MLRETVERVRPLVGDAGILVVTNAMQAAGVRRALPEIGRRAVLAEPVGRNTAAAVALAALHLHRRDPHGVMAVLPADHVIGRVRAFQRCLRTALRVADDTGALVTLGVEPTHPETGYGYIRVGSPIRGYGAGVARVARFIEKPGRARASALLRRGGVLWNSGMFAWRVDRILEELERHVPEILRPLQDAVGRGARALERAYRHLPAVSIDVGVLERAKDVAVVQARFPWSDVGSWAALEQVWGQRGGANAVRGRVVSIDSAGCVVDAGTRLVALLGLEDVVVVDTPDAVLVCRKDQAQDVRRVVAALEGRGWTEYL